METSETNSKVDSYTLRAIRRIENSQDKAAILAELRRTVGRSLMSARDVWPFLYKILPADICHGDTAPTDKEEAIYSALQIYALCMQGSHTVTPDSTYKLSIGGSLRAGKTDTLDKRFATLLIANDYDVLIRYLRQMIQIVKNTNTITINYPCLAQDLYRIRLGNISAVLRKWALDYYVAK